ncbi:unnamed protein product [Arctogadus glacialis]
MPMVHTHSSTPLPTCCRGAKRARYTCHAGGTREPTVEWLHNAGPGEDGTDDQSELGGEGLPLRQSPSGQRRLLAVGPFDENILAVGPFDENILAVGPFDENILAVGPFDESDPPCPRRDRATIDTGEA